MHQYVFTSALSHENRQHPCLLMNALLVSHPCETLGVQLRASMPVPCQRSGAVARKKFGRLPEGLSLHQPFQNRTISLAFRRGVGLPLPLHRTFPFPQPLQKDNNPSPRITFQNRTIPRKSTISFHNPTFSAHP